MTILRLSALLAGLIIVPAMAASRPAAAPRTARKVNKRPLVAPKSVSRRPSVSGARSWCTSPDPARDRTRVRTGGDPEAGKISLSPIKTTIERLVSLTRPADLPMDEWTQRYQLRRVDSVETTVWTLDARLDEYLVMEDGTYHLVLKEGKGTVMTAAIPDPRSIPRNSPWGLRMEAVRRQFTEQFKPTRQPQRPGVPVRITGVGFFETRDPQRPLPGLAKNGIALCPVLEIGLLASRS